MTPRLASARANSMKRGRLIQWSWRVLREVLRKIKEDVDITIEENPAFWVPRFDYDLYYTDTIQEKPLINAAGKIASRSCLLSFLSAIRAGQIWGPGIYASIGTYYRPEPVVVSGVREPIFPQLEIEVMDPNPEIALTITLNLLGEILAYGRRDYEVRIQGILPPKILTRPEVRYAGVGRHWKHYKTKKNIGFEAYFMGSENAIAGGGDFSELAWRFGLDRMFSAVGFGLGLLRLT